MMNQAMSFNQENKDHSFEYVNQSQNSYNLFKNLSLFYKKMDKLN